MKSLTEVKVAGRRVLIRVDFNVPLGDELSVTDDTRIKRAIPTIQWVIDNGGIPILMSHLGEPDGRRADALSLKPVAAKLREVSNWDVRLAPDCVGSEVDSMSKSLEPGQVLLLENLRFHSGETNNDMAFARGLASLGEVYVNDAFASAHRRHASIVAVPRFLKDRAAGLLMEKELEYYDRSLENPKRPLCVVLGGLKVSTKLSLLLKVASKTDKLILGGALATTFLAAQGLQMGRSKYEHDFMPKILELLGTLARRDSKVYLPVDFMVAPSPSSKGLARAVPSLEVPADMMVLDIGPATQLLYKEALQSAETILWNGPMGAFENEEFSKGTTDIIEGIASSHAVKIAGGGETLFAIHQMQLEHKFDFVSTGGGAFLALLEGKELPAVEALES